MTCSRLYYAKMDGWDDSVFPLTCSSNVLSTLFHQEAGSLFAPFESGRIFAASASRTERKCHCMISKLAIKDNMNSICFFLGMLVFGTLSPCWENAQATRRGHIPASTSSHGNKWVRPSTFKGSCWGPRHQDPRKSWKRNDYSGSTTLFLHNVLCNKRWWKLLNTGLTNSGTSWRSVPPGVAQWEVGLPVKCDCQKHFNVFYFNVLMFNMNLIKTSSII